MNINSFNFVEVGILKTIIEDNVDEKNVLISSLVAEIFNEFHEENVINLVELIGENNYSIERAKFAVENFNSLKEKYQQPEPMIDKKLHDDCFSRYEIEFVVSVLSLMKDNKEKINATNLTDRINHYSKLNNVFDEKYTKKRTQLVLKNLDKIKKGLGIGEVITVNIPKILQ
jgi:hypothetical protein